MAGLFDYEDPQSVGNMAMAAGLLNAGGPSRMPISAGQGIAQGLLMRQQAASEAAQNARRNALVQSQIERNMRNKDYMTVGKNLFNLRTGQFVELPAGMTADDLPSDVVSFNEFMKKSPEDQQKWLDFRRQNYRITDVGGVPSNVRAGPELGTAQPSVQPLSALAIELEAARRKAVSQAAGKATGEAAGTAETQLAGADIDTSIMEKTVNDMKGHPGQKWAVGVPLVSQLPESFTLAGTQHADFLAKYKQAKGKIFLEGYKTLKGGGQITEIEGTKAQDAIARMDRAQSKEAFDNALDDYLGAYKAGVEKLKRQRALGNREPTSPADIRAEGERLLGPRPAAQPTKSADQMSVEEIRAELENIRNRRQ